jgi:hypothetical protein
MNLTLKNQPLQNHIKKKIEIPKQRNKYTKQKWHQGVSYRQI